MLQKNKKPKMSFMTKCMFLLLLINMNSTCEFNFMTCVDISGSINGTYLKESEFLRDYYMELWHQSWTLFNTAIFSFNKDAEMVRSFTTNQREIFRGIENIEKCFSNRFKR